MMGSKERTCAPLITASLEEVVPQDHFYRHLERTHDVSCVREFVQSLNLSGIVHTIEVEQFGEVATGQVMVGAPVSCTTTVWLQVAVLPLQSLAVHVRVTL